MARIGEHSEPLTGRLREKWGKLIHRMSLPKAAIAAAALLGLALIPSVAEAANARTTATITLRAGPSTIYPSVGVVPRGSFVNVYGCVANYAWCDVGYHSARGWASSRYLTALYHGVYEPLPGIGLGIGVPFIIFNFGDYWDDHYRGMKFFHDRDRFNPDHHKPPKFNDNGPNCFPGSKDSRCKNPPEKTYRFEKPLGNNGPHCLPGSNDPRCKSAPDKTFRMEKPSGNNGPICGPGSTDPRCKSGLGNNKTLLMNRSSGENDLNCGSASQDPRCKGAPGKK